MLNIFMIFDMLHLFVAYLARTKMPPLGRPNFFTINAPGMDRFQLFDLGVMG